jgi:hypothetical protein
MKVVSRFCGENTNIEKYLPEIAMQNFSTTIISNSVVRRRNRQETQAKVLLFPIYVGLVLLSFLAIAWRCF